MMTGLRAQQPAGGLQTETSDFSGLLSEAMAAPNTVDVAQAMGLWSAPEVTADAALTQGVTVVGVRDALYPVASARAAVSSGMWTGNVDTSDRMLEKAAPYMDIINDASSVYDVPVNVIMAVIKAESDYQVDCVSRAGAMGLMQIMPENAEYFGVTDAFDPRQNIMCGTEEISRHLRSYDGDLRLALAAYNTGPGNVARRGVTSSSSEEYSRIPESVRAYADRVMRYAGLSG